MLESINLIRRGKVRRSKLYYLRQRSGKSARIAEKKDLVKKKVQNAKNAVGDKKIAYKNSDVTEPSKKKSDLSSEQKESKENKTESK